MDLNNTSSLGTPQKKKSKSKFDFGKLIARILCIVVAFIIWVYVKEIDDEKYTNIIENVRIEFANEEQAYNSYDLSVFSDSAYYCDVTVVGSKNFVNKVTAKDIRAYVDLADIKTTGAYELEVKFDIPDEVELEHSSVTSIPVYMDKKSVKSLTLYPKLRNSSYPSDCHVDDLVATETTITVTGPNYIMQTVDYAVVYIDTGYITTSKSVAGTVELVDINGTKVSSQYMNFSKTNVEVYVPLYTSKTIDVTYSLKHNVLDDNNSIITVSPSTITIKGDPEILKDINSYNVEIDETKLASSNDTFAENLVFSNSVYVLDEIDEITINVNLLSNSVKKITLTYDKINKSSTTANVTLLSSSIDFSIIGSNALLAGISANDFSTYLDLTDYKKSSEYQIVEIPVMVTIKDNYYSDVKIINKPTVKVQIN